MKKLIAALCLIACTSVSAHARSQRMQIDTQDFAVELCTATAISIASYTATNVLSQLSLSSATFVEVYNADSSTYINYGFESNVSTIAPTATTPSPAFGREVSPKTGIGLTINRDKMPGLWVLTQKTTGATSCVVTTCR